MANDVVDENMVFIYHAESTDLLEEMEASLLHIQENGFSKEHMDSIFRVAHTLKGGATLVQFDVLVDFAHITENFLDKVRNQEISLDDEKISLLLKIKDHFMVMIENNIQNDCIENYPQDIQDTTGNYKEKLLEYSQQKTTPQAKEQPVKEEEFISEDPQEDSVSVTVDEEVILEVEKKEEIKTQKTTKEPKATKQTTTKRSSSFLKVESSKIDSIINLLGEMVITTASVVEHSKRVKDKPLKDRVDTLYKILEELREASMKTRMFPISDTFNKFKRTVRDLQLELRKDIELCLEGEDTELDRVILEKISDPLMHLIRNSIDHGIETVEERIQANKPKTAKLTLSASHEAGNIVIKVKDDGRGLNAQKILNKAVQKGLVSQNAKLQEQEIFNLILQPGFSTKEDVTELSGRGVGMDVVKKNIDQLGGSIEINSKPTKGMTVTIKLRLTLAIIDGFMIKLTNKLFVMPLEMILECIEMNEEHQKTIQKDGLINLRNKALPILNLKEFFGYKTNENEIYKENIVVVMFGISKVGLIVDELLGEFQTVIKPMSKIFENLKGISGATIMGDGSVTPILDIPVLLEYANKKYK
jgi:two-component system chemotaxis sensor kinase CheA